MIIKTITAHELREKLTNNEVTLIDVREPEEYYLEYIEGSHLIPLRMLSLETLPTKIRPLVIHCHAGVRSAEACRRLLIQDPNLEVYNLEGGIIAWSELHFRSV